MGKLEDPTFRYYTKAESEQPGYLERRMAIYKEMVKYEQDRGIHPQQEDIRIQQGNRGSFFNQQINSKSGAQLIVVGKKG